MVQNSIDIANGSGLQVRTAMNNALLSLVSDFSGSSAPSPTYAYMTWVDTSGTDPIVKQRNGANNAWITLGTIVSNTFYPAGITAKADDSAVMKKNASTAFTAVPIGSSVFTLTDDKNFVQRSHINPNNFYNDLCPQCVNFAGTILTISNSRPALDGASVPIVGNTQYKGLQTQFTVSSTIELPIAPNGLRTVILKNPATADLTQAANVAYACQKPQRSDIFDSTKDALLTFSSTISDAYGNTVTTIGNPAVSGGKYVGDGTGDGFKITTITVLDRGISPYNQSWCIEGKFKFNTNNTLYYLMSTKATYGFRLTRNASNKLQLYVSSNGSSWNEVNGTEGSKSNYNTSSEYHICLTFSGGVYNLTVDGTQDLNVTGKNAVYDRATTGIGGLVFGINPDESTNSLAGTMDNIRVTLGNLRYVASGFTPEADPSADAWWFDTKNRIMKCGGGTTWTEYESAVAVGEIITAANVCTNVYSYATNGRLTQRIAGVYNNTNNAISHYLGTDNVYLKGEYINARGTTNLAYRSGYRIGDGADYASNAGSALINVNGNTGILATSSAYIYGSNGYYFTHADAIVVAEYSHR
jgi:hypothetical protein